MEVCSVSETFPEHACDNVGYFLFRLIHFPYIIFSSEMVILIMLCHKDCLPKYKLTQFDVGVH